LSNAIKNTAKGGHITLKLKLADAELPFKIKNQLAGNANYATISVTDNGRGIPGELLNRIFERFFVSSSIKERFPLDSGVGLELTKRLVELHKGYIIVESEEQSSDKPGFTRFTIFLPLGRDHLQEDEMMTGVKNREGSSPFDRSMVSDAILDDSSWITNEAEDPSLKSKPSDDKLRLLIVEDNSEVRIFIRTLFAGHYQVDEAENGLEGLEKAIDNVPDLIICDIMMPEMDGMELCKRVKTDVRISHIPVILLTARTAVTFKYEGLETGADDYITKPFSADYLILRVRNLIRQRETFRNHFTMELICDPAKITVTSVDEKLLKKAVDYIGDHMSDSCLSVEKLSSELGLSRVHLYRKIKALTNLTAVEFIRSIRIKRAAWLLQENKMNVNEVCAMVGFDDVDYFRNCFKQQFGASPTEYSKKHKTTTTN
jgi:CheY-like chemotaxis protein/predicted DNA-binding transcriptional regulator AlpA